MQIDRELLLEYLKIVTPIILTKSLIPELGNVWLDGKNIYVYNGMVGIQLPFKSDIKIGIDGILLRQFLEKSRAKSVEFVIERELLIKAANARLKLPAFNINKSIWNLPDYNKDKYVELQEPDLDLLKTLLITVGKNSTVPDQLGITLIPNGSELFLFSHDSITFSWGKIAQSVHIDRLVLPTEFCQFVVKTFNSSCKFYFNDSFVIATDNKASVFGTYVEVDSPSDFVLEIGNHYTDDLQFILVPELLRLVLARILIINKNKEEALVQIIINKNRLRIRSETISNNLTDSIKLDKNYDDCEITINPYLMNRLLDRITHFAITSECMILSNQKNYTHFISAL